MLKLLRFLKNNKLVTSLGPLLKLAEALMETFVPFIMSLMINRGINEGDRSFIIKMGVLLLLIAVFGWIFAILAQYFCAKSAMIFGGEIRKALYNKILKMDMKTIDMFTIPSLITRTTNDVNRVQTGLNQMLRLMLRIPFIILGSIIMTGVINGKLALIYLIIIPLLTIIAAFVVKHTMPLYTKIQKKIDRITTFCRENIIGVKSVRAFRMQNKESSDFKEKTQELYDTQVKAEYYNSAVAPLNSIVINIGIIAILIIGASLVNKNKLLNGDIIALVNYLIQILIAVERACELVASFNKAETSSKRVNEILDYKESESSANLVDNAIVSSNLIEFNNVSFTYDGGKNPSLYDVSFSLKDGESLGIIGGTGSGKTTISNLLLRMYNVTNGAIRLYNQNILSYNDRDVKDMFSIFSQKPQLFKGTIRENMKLGNSEATDLEIMEALKNAEALDFVNEKGGLDFFVEYGGRNLSGGQKQRLTIARALLKNADFLVLDDSTSALDFVTESKIRKYVLNTLEKFKCKIIISQRISAVSSCTKILVLDGGTVCGFGTHDQLLESCQVYKEILMSQTGELLKRGGVKS